MSQEDDKIKLTDAQKAVFRSAAKLYEKGRYAEALKGFESLAKQSDDLAYALRYYVRFCNNVLGAEASGNDKLYELSKKLTKFLWCSALILSFQVLSIFSNKELRSFSFGDWGEIAAGVAVVLAMRVIYRECPSGNKLKCKYCGHYTNYIPPNEGLAYLESNNCGICGRGYPMPSIHWDSDWGQTYIYERGSVSEKKFYKEFEAMNPDYPKSEMADQILRGKKPQR
jgi:hypothetical protein